ncbi:MAG: hypothetical protein IJ519_06555 [Clostridia bacterium]|nr:hypothetical protein [Clostridia bacterium]
MKYCVKDQLDMFEFHDSSFSFVEYKDGDLTVNVKHLNVHKNTEQNSEDHDMEIECAKVTFKGFRVGSFIIRDSVQPAPENSPFKFTLIPGRSFVGKEAEAKASQELIHGILVCDFKKTNDNYYFIDGIGTGTLCSIKCTFDNATVEWDKYMNKAWYEPRKCLSHEIKLDTPSGEQTAEGFIYCSENEENYGYKEYNGNKFAKQPNISVGVIYNGKKLLGHGKDHLWMDAFADLQRQLPEGVTLKCCLTCRHGNLCPYGNAPGQVFCTKDRNITSKDDMCNLFDTCDTRALEHEITDCCDDFVHQSDDFYTYNDYLFHLKRALDTEE